MGRLRASANRGVSSISLIHPEAIYDINFASGQWFGALPSDLVVSRASEALTLTAGNTYANFASNTARITGNGLLIEEARTNGVRNNSMSGASAGSPGTLPTNWNFFTSLTGLTRTIVGTGVEDGIDYIDIRLSGTPSGAGTYQFYTESGNVNPAVSGEVWVNSGFFKLQAGSLTGVSAVRLYFEENNSGGAYLTEQNTSITNPTSASLGGQRAVATRTLNQATTAFVKGGFNLSLSGAAIDVTLRVGTPQLEKGAFATSPIRTTGSAATRPADVVYLPISGVGTEYTIYAQTAILETHVSSGALIEAWASSSDRIRPNISQATQGGSVTSGGSSRSIAAFTAGSGAARKVAMRVQGGNIIVACNGSLGTADTGAAPTVAPSRLYFGSGAGGTAAFLNDELLRGAIIPRALTDAELQTLTT